MILNQEEVLNIPLKNNILQAVDETLSEALQKHNKVFVMRMDIHFPQKVENKMIARFTRRFNERERRHGYDPKHITVKEISDSGRIHFHMALFLDGNKTQSIKPHIDNANTVMNNILKGECDNTKGLIDSCSHGHNNGIMIKRESEDYIKINELSRQLSYLAKEDQKENIKGKTFFYSKK